MVRPSQDDRAFETNFVIGVVSQMSSDIRILATTKTF